MKAIDIPGILAHEATEVMGGGEVFDSYRTMRRQKAMSRHLLRQMFMTKAKEWVAEQDGDDLGLICELGVGLEFNPSHTDHNHEYEDSTIVTSGTNAWSRIFLSAADSGLILLQKIAVATILETIICLVSSGQPDLGRDGWMPIELRGEDVEFNDVLRAEKAIAEKLGW